MEGVKSGRGDAVVRSLVRQETVDSWPPSTMIVRLISARYTYQPTIQYAPHRRRHIHVFSNHEIRSDRRDHSIASIIHLALPPILLADHPYPAVVDLGPILRRILRDHKLEPLHLPQLPFERYACLEQRVPFRPVKRLVANDGVVGGRVEEGRLGEVGQD